MNDDWRIEKYCDKGKKTKKQIIWSFLIQNMLGIIIKTWNMLLDIK